MTDEERTQIVDRLRSSRQRIRGATARLTEPQWRFKPDAETWSAAECTEHIVEVESSTLSRIQELVRTQSPNPAPPPDAPRKDRFLLKALPNREIRVKAPAGRAATAGWPAGTPYLDHFEKARDRTMEYAATTSDDLRFYFAPHFVLDMLDGYQWLLMIALHAERHAAQIEELKARPDFPAA